jgi:hypothetical protein
MTQILPNNIFSDPRSEVDIGRAAQS